MSNEVTIVFVELRSKHDVLLILYFHLATFYSNDIFSV